MTRGLALWMTLMMTSAGWGVTFTPHADNSVLQITVTCGKDFLAISRYAIDPTQLSASTYRVSTPLGVPCYAIADIMRNAEHSGVADDEQVGESTSLHMPAK